MTREFSLIVVGADYPNRRGPARRFEIEICRPGEPVELRLERTNPADPRAIAVYSARGIQIGYIQAERAQLVGTLLARHSASASVFQAKHRAGAIIRLNTAGKTPSLPVRTASPPPDDDWWPDEEWPDEFV